MATKLFEDGCTDADADADADADDVDVDVDVDVDDGAGSAGNGTAKAAGDGVAEAGAGADEADEATGAAGLQLFCLLLIVRILNSRCRGCTVYYISSRSKFLSFFRIV